MRSSSAGLVGTLEAATTGAAAAGGGGGGGVAAEKAGCTFVGVDIALKAGRLVVGSVGGRDDAGGGGG